MTGCRLLQDPVLKTMAACVDDVSVITNRTTGFTKNATGARRTAHENADASVLCPLTPDS